MVSRCQGQRGKPRASVFSLWQCPLYSHPQGKNPWMLLYRRGRSFKAVAKIVWYKVTESSICGVWTVLSNYKDETWFLGQGLSIASLLRPIGSVSLSYGAHRMFVLCSRSRLFSLRGRHSGHLEAVEDPGWFTSANGFFLTSPFSTWQSQTAVCLYLLCLFL